MAKGLKVEASWRGGIGQDDPSNLKNRSLVCAFSKTHFSFWTTTT